MLLEHLTNVRVSSIDDKFRYPASPGYCALPWAATNKFASNTTGRLANDWIKKGRPIGRPLYMAERQGFEPWEGCPSTVFKTAAFDHSATSPEEHNLSIRRARTLPQTAPEQFTEKKVAAKPGQEAIKEMGLGDSKAAR